MYIRRGKVFLRTEKEALKLGKDPRNSANFLKKIYKARMKNTSYLNYANYLSCNVLYEYTLLKNLINELTKANELLVFH